MQAYFLSTSINNIVLDISWMILCDELMILFLHSCVDNVGIEPSIY